MKCYIDGFYAWIKLLDPNKFSRLIIFDEQYVQQALQELEPLFDHGYNWLNVTRLFKHIGFFLLRSVNKQHVLLTFNRNQVYALSSYKNLIAKPVTGARTVGIIVADFETIMNLCLNPDIFVSQESFYEYLEKRGAQVASKVSYENYTYEVYKDGHIVLQPYIEDVIHEYRFYIAFDGNIFPYCVERPVPYLEKRGKQQSNIRDVKTLTNIDIGQITNIVKQFIRLSGKHYPFLSIDVIQTKETFYIIDYGIEFNFLNLLEDKTVFNLFQKWINDKVYERISSLYGSLQ